MSQSLSLPSVPDRVAAGRDILVQAGWVVGALALSLFLQDQRLFEVWTGGGFYDTDDAMRMAQVRDLVAGQHWYDMTQYRLDPPQAVALHWSRIVDIPLVLLLKLFGLFLAPEQAERAARIAFPTGVLAVLLAGGAWAARIFADASARAYGVLAVLLCGVMFWQFPPGRVDHHAPQITLLFFSVAALARALDPAEGRWAALSGGCIAVSLGIGLENMPFFVLIAAPPGLVFAWRGEDARPMLLSFAAGLGFTLVVVFVLTVGVSRWLVPACDALSAPWMVSTLGGSVAYGVLSFSGKASRVARFLALGVLGAGVAAMLALLWPDCLRPPYSEVDPLLKSLWIDRIAENQTIWQDLAGSPGAALLTTIPILIGLAGALFGVVTSRGLARARWFFLLAVVATGVVAGSLCLRVFSSTMPLAAMGLLAPALFVRDRLASRSAIVAGVLSFLLLFALSAFGVAIAMPDLPQPLDADRLLDAAWKRPDPCLDSISYEPLAGMPPGLAVAPLQSGAYLLAHTSLSVVAAGYHRGEHGNRAVIDIFRAEPAQAESLARHAGAKYILLCWATPGDAYWWKYLSPSGLAAQLEEGKAPNWLRELTAKDAVMHVFEVRPPNG
ncbi:hypothetical protein [Rhodoblastus sp.]|uniref:hypothetical protein n=1 Tax=Rhodoblastus sp. TaxID=1962975 RepID=UPI0035B15065